MYTCIFFVSKKSKKSKKSKNNQKKFPKKSNQRQKIHKEPKNQKSSKSVKKKRTHEILNYKKKKKSSLFLNIKNMQFHQSSQLSPIHRNFFLEKSQQITLFKKIGILFWQKKMLFS